MSNENDQLLPDESDAQTLNKMAAQIKSMDSRLEVVETKVDAQSKQTNANLLNAFAEILKDALAQQKAEFDEALAQQKAEFAEALAQQKTEFAEMLKTEVNNLRLEMLQEFQQVKREIKSIERSFHPIFKNMGDEAMRTDEIEDRVEKLEKKLAS